MTKSAPDQVDGSHTGSIPGWMRTTARNPETLDDATFAAGAALAALDAAIRRSERWAGAWRHRLALAAAANTARQSGRIEDEAALRDAVMLTRSSDDVGPAGRILLAWRSLASRPTQSLLSRDSLSTAIAGFGHADAGGVANDLADQIKERVASGGNPAATAVAAFELVRDHRNGAVRDLAPWVADAVLANGFRWPHAVPLIAVQLATGAGHARLRLSEGGQEALRMRLLSGYARAALRAIDLSADLGRRAEALLAVTPKLRAKGAAAVVEKLLGEEAVSGSQAVVGISDRGLRRLFDRLGDLGGVRELSGRPTFRLYGL